MDDTIKLENLKLNRQQIFAFLTMLIVSAMVLRLMVGYTTVHYFDLSFYVDWSAGAAEDFFGAYETVKNLDYPPLFLFPLFFTGHLMEHPGISGFSPYAMLALKGWQMLFDVAIIPLLYLVLRRVNLLAALGAATLWAVNPTILYNSAYWGQTDCIMMFLLVLAFYLLLDGRPVIGSVVMTLACLMKFQSLYFAPLFGLVLLTAVPVKRIFQSIGAGLSVAILIFAPFCMRSGWDLPWKIYFGGFERYQGASLNAFNLYSALGMNYWGAGTPLVGGFTVENASMVFLMLALVALLFFYFTAMEKSVWLLGFFFMQTIFMFTSRMHERYQVPVLILLLIACVVHKSRGLFLSYCALTLMTFANHFFVLEEILTGDKQMAWVARFDNLVVTCSIINLLLYFVTLAVTIHIFYRRGFHNPIPASWRRPPALT